MELKKLHMGTMSYASDSMDEVATQLATALDVSSQEKGVFIGCTCRYRLADRAILQKKAKVKRSSCLAPEEDATCRQESKM